MPLFEVVYRKRVSRKSKGHKPAALSTSTVARPMNVDAEQPAIR